MPLIQNMMGILLEICIFFKYSAKRQGLFEENITQICVESSKNKLVKVKRYKLPCITQQTIYSELFRTIGTIENFLELFGTLILNNYNGNFFRTFENFSSNNILY